MSQNTGDEVYGAGCAVFLYKAGTPQLIDQFPVICKATTAQQAEAAGSIAAYAYLKDALEKVSAMEGGGWQSTRANRELRRPSA